MEDVVVFAVNTDEVLPVLLGENNPSLVRALVGQQLTDMQCERLSGLCAREMERQHPLLRARPVPADTPEGQKLERTRWLSHMTTLKGPRLQFKPFVPARTFPLRDILFLIVDRSLVTTDDPQGVAELMEFLVDVPNNTPFQSPVRRWLVRQALLTRFPLLHDVDPPHPPLHRKDQVKWFETQERRFGTALLVTALPPQPEAATPTQPEPAPAQAAATASTSGDESGIPMHLNRVGMYQHTN